MQINFQIKYHLLKKKTALFNVQHEIFRVLLLIFTTTMTKLFDHVAGGTTPLVCTLTIFFSVRNYIIYKIDKYILIGVMLWGKSFSNYSLVCYLVNIIKSWLLCDERIIS